VWPHYTNAISGYNRDPMPDDSLLMQLAGAIANATSPDWDAAQSTTSSWHRRRLVKELRIVAELAAVHRGLSTAMPEETSASRPGERTRWGPFEFRDPIGSGHFGTVYLAWDSALERQVAVKLLRETARSAEMIQEGRLLARVRHPNVVTIYGVDSHDGVVGLWMEFVDGLSLARVLATRGAMEPAEAASIGVDLCRAVAAVHKAGLVHRDIKAQNVMREGGGRIVLMDFGAGEIRHERSRGSAGTPLYLAPELFAGRPATIASDIYSIGVLLFHVVTMRYPVEGTTQAQIEAAHARHARQRLADLRPDLPESFVAVVECALQRDPARRFRDCEAMGRDLMHTVPGHGSPDGAAGAAGRHTATTAVAVLPFVNLGPDRDVEYFSHGLADDLLTALAKVPGLRVVSRTSAARLAEIETDVRSICRQLGVDALLEGTVRKAGDRVRITAQLVSAVDGCHLWSEGYERPLADVFAVEDEIARSVVDRLKVSLAELPQRPLINRHTQNTRAYEAYLKGRFYWTRRYHGGLVAALDHFKKAIEEDAGYALAYAGLADAYTFIGVYAVQRPRSVLPAALAAAERALALDPNLPEAHTSLAFIKLANDWDLPGAARAFTRALELDPREAVTRIYYSWLLVLLGDVPSAMTQVRSAQECEPLSPLVNAGAGHTLYLARRYEEGIVECEKSLEIDPNFILGIHVMGMCRALQGSMHEAIEIGERTAMMAGRAPFYLGVLGHYYARSGAVEAARAILDELDAVADTRYVPPHCQTYIYAGLNDLDRALEWQAKAQDDGASPFYYLSPLIENLRADPRHVDQMRKMGWKW
jgi:TolB-like protein/Tfp pilus assembly protein PilF